MNNTLNLGVLGAAKIARTHIIPALNAVQGVKLWGVASRTQAKAHAYVSDLASHNIKANNVDAGTVKAIEGYESLINHPEVDVIYNPLPNDLHVPLTLKALAAGKHVICEKPIALDAKEAAVLSKASANSPECKVMEAFMYRFHPQWQQVLEWVNTGKIGQLRSVASQFSYSNNDPDNIRNQLAAGGGAMMDVGCYGVSVARMIFNAEPTRVVASAMINPTFGVDDMTHCLMDFNGAHATVLVGTKMQRSQQVLIEGSAGRIVMTHPFYCDPGDERVVSLITDNNEQAVTFGSNIDHYQLMLQAFVDAIHNDTCVPLSLEDSVANMAVIDAVFASVKSGSWALVG